MIIALCSSLRILICLELIITQFSILKGTGPIYKVAIDQSNGVCIMYHRTKH